MGLGWLVGVVVIALVVWVLMRGSIGSDTLGERRRALDILKERYARGEIDHEEFEQKKRDLQS